MPTHVTSLMDKPSGRPARLLLGLTGALLALLMLNLAVFDDLRVDPSAGALETFLKPQHLSSLMAVVLVAGLVAFKHRAAARVAVVVAWIEIAAFGCMWSTCLNGMNECSGVSIDDGRGLRLNVQ